MERRRWLELMRSLAAKLTLEERLEGWHFCCEWDGLLVDPMSPEWGDNLKRCRCGHEIPPEDATSPAESIA